MKKIYIYCSSSGKSTECLKESSVNNNGRKEKDVWQELSMLCM